MKRLFDIFGALAGLVLLAPLFAVIAWLVRREDGGPVFFRQARVGRAGQEFRIWKFRTMVVGADRIGPPLTADGDARITRVGAWLRKTKLDELPQLFNVLAGQMSLVGPRPEVPRYVCLYNDRQRRVLDVPPGITDPASLEYFDEEAILAQSDDPEEAYVREVMPAKIRLNLEYQGRATAATDICVIARTLKRIWKSKSAARRTVQSGLSREKC